MRALDDVESRALLRRGARHRRRERRRQIDADEDPRRRLSGRARQHPPRRHRPSRRGGRRMRSIRASSSSTRNSASFRTAPSPRTSSSAICRATRSASSGAARSSGTPPRILARVGLAVAAGNAGAPARHRPAAARRDRARPVPRGARHRHGRAERDADRKRASHPVPAPSRALKQAGVGIIFISHHLEEVFEICDRVTVMRDGHTRGDAADRRLDAGQPRPGHGQPPDRRRSSPKRDVALGDALLEVEGLTLPGRFEDVSFARAGGRDRRACGASSAPAAPRCSRRSTARCRAPRGRVACRPA